MYYGDIKKYDVANGPGIRVSLFVSGCTHHCPGCFNSETWDFNYGKPFTNDTIEEIIKYMSLPYIKGFTLLGGDPFEESNQTALLPLMRRIWEVYPDKDVWCYTGYDFEKDILENMYINYPDTKELLSYIDVMVDGEFVMELKDLNLRFKGSSNQRTIMVQESMEKGEIVLYNFDEE